MAISAVAGLIADFGSNWFLFDLLAGAGSFVGWGWIEYDADKFLNG